MDYIETHRDTISSASILVYLSRWCSDCHNLVKFLADAGIKYEQVDISEDNEAADKLFAGIGKHATPYMQVNGETFVRGYHKEEPGLFSAEVLINELVAAIKPE